MLSESEIEKRRVWQEKIYRILKNIKRMRKRVLGKEFLVLPDVFPLLWDSEVLAKAVRKEARKGDIVLDMGTGTGVQAVFASGKAAKVLAVDINPAAVKCARLNAKLSGLEGKIKAVRSDLFSNVREKFDLIIFNPPFRWFRPRDMAERSTVDEDYATLSRFLSKAGAYLKAKGRIIMVFSTSGDMGYFERLVGSGRFSSEVLAREKKRNGWTYVVYRLTK